MTPMTNRLLDELANDAREYLELLERLRNTPPGTEEYGDLEGELYAQVVQLVIHGEGVQDAIDEETDLAPVGTS